MCGFHFIWSANGIIDQGHALRSAVKSGYRGSDLHDFSSGKSQNGQGYFLLANRLAITGSKSQKQPLRSANGRYLFAMNGEIYNYHDLAKRLGLEEYSTDTEVAFAWIVAHDHIGLADFEGLFSLVFIDLEQGTWFAAKDRFGSRPLYFSKKNGQFIISSTVDFILQVHKSKPKLNSSGLKQFFRYHFTVPPHTIWQDVYSLGAQGLLLNSGEETVWSVDPELKLDRENSTSVNAILSNIVFKQYHQPSALLFSGGIDSSLLLNAFSQPGLDPPHLYHADLGHKKDLEFSRSLATLLKAELTEIDVKRHINPENFNEFLNGLDYPIGDSGFYLTWLVCGLMEKEVKVVYSGAGADELSAGYRRHLFFHYVSRLPVSLKPVLQKLGLWPDLKSSTTTWDFKELLARTSIPADLFSKNNFLETDQNSYLAHGVLLMSDQAAMLHGKELRIPFLGHDLVNYFKRLSPEELLKSGRKTELKKAWMQAFPQFTVPSGKRGFGLADTDLLESCMDLSYLDFENEHKQIIEHFSEVMGVSKYQIYKKSLHQWALAILVGYVNKYL